VRALFDVNFLIAMLDTDHVRNARAQDWWDAEKESGWATCPLTQNGFVRVVSQPGYKNPIAMTFALDLLAQQMAETDHAFWPDDISILDTYLFDRDRILGPGQLTDIYLLGLTVKNDGRLVTLDQTIPLAAVRGAQARHVVVI
jgi:toxin-antitoxin system PIN domain toxin